MCILYLLMKDTPKIQAHTYIHPHAISRTHLNQSSSTSTCTHTHTHSHTHTSIHIHKHTPPSKSNHPTAIRCDTIENMQLKKRRKPKEHIQTYTVPRTHRVCTFFGVFFSFPDTTHTVPRTHPHTPQPESNHPAVLFCDPSENTQLQKAKHNQKNMYTHKVSLAHTSTLVKSPCCDAL